MSPATLLLENAGLLAEKDRLAFGIARRDAVIEDQRAKIEQLAREVDALSAHLKRLLAGRGGAHLIPEGQAVLFPVESDSGSDEPTPEHANEAPDGEPPGDPIKRRNKPNRPATKIDTSALPCEEVVHELPEDERVCPETGVVLVPVDEKISDEIHFVPARVTLIVHKQIIYGAPAEIAQERMIELIMAPLPPRALEGCRASGTLLAEIIVQKYVNHLPLYRQESIFEREGLRLPRQTTCDWLLGSADALRPIAQAQLERIRAGPVVQLDDTPVRCQGPKGSGNFQAYLWTIANPEVSGIAYQFTASRAAAEIEPLLAGVEGILVGDGYPGHGAAARSVEGEIVLAGCWAHVLRKFRDALQEVPGSARLFMHEIGLLYDIERRADEGELDADQRKAARRAEARPILARLLWRTRDWAKQYSESGKIAEAIKYMRNQWTSLKRFLEDGRVPIDNNRCERAIRPIAVGRKNWLFAGSERGGHAAAIFYTLVESCRQAGVEPRAYLADVLVRVATHPARLVDELLPAQWAQRFAPVAPSQLQPA